MNKTEKLYKTLLSAFFSAVIVICSFITVPAPIPFTLQTLGIFIACFYLDFVASFCSVAVYILLGVVGLPVFAGFQGGLSAIFGPTGGFILGFLFIPLINGILSKLFGTKFRVLYMILGLVLCYLLGSVWYLIYLEKSSYFAVLLTAVLPFVIPDIIKLILAERIARLLQMATARMKIGSKDKLIGSQIKAQIKRPVNVFVFDEIDSTNSEAARKIRQGATLPAVFIAEKQTAGRGRRGRTFFSKGGLYMTMAVDYKKTDIVKITTLSSVAVAEAIKDLTGENVGIKWVNDIYLSDKKICGILCENVKDPKTNKSLGVIIGVGVNLNVKSFPKELKGIAGSLNSNKATKNLLAAKIANNLLNEIESDKDYIERYKKMSIVIGKEICFERNKKTYCGLVCDINENGELLVKTNKGEEVLNSGEISVKLKKS